MWEMKDATYTVHFEPGYGGGGDISTITPPNQWQFNPPINGEMVLKSTKATIKEQIPFVHTQRQLAKGKFGQITNSGW